MSRRFLPTVALFAACALPALAQPSATPDDKARALVQTGKLADALKELQAAAKADPKRTPPRVALAALCFRARNGRAARAMLEQGAVEDPKHPEVYLLNGNFAYGEGRVTDAILNLQTALRLAAEPRWDPDQRKRFTREAHLGLASSYEARRDWPAVKEHLLAVLTADPKNGAARQRLATALFHTGKADEGFAALRTAYADDPASELPELRMAALYGADNDAAKAEEWLKKAVAAHAQDARTHRGYAGWLLNQGKPDAAQAYLDSAAKLDATGRETLALRGLMARYRKKFADAEPVFEKLHRDSPNDPFAVWNLALTLAETGDKEKQRRAVELADSEVRRNGRSPEAYSVLGWCYARAGRLDDAERALTAAANLGPLSRDAGYFFARVLADKGRWEDAYNILKSVSNARGAYVYRADAEALLAEAEKKKPAKPEPKK
jgi:tetratricopeptide (TPR) repeat protein